MKTRVNYRRYGSFPDLDTVKDIVLYGAKQGGDKKQYMFYNFAGEVETKSFRQVFYDVHGLGQMLYGRGLRGKKIAILGENSYYWVAAYFSVITGKMAAVPLDPQLDAEELKDLLVRSSCDAIYYSASFDDMIAHFRQDRDIPVTEYLPLAQCDALVREGYDALSAGAQDYMDDKVLPEDLAFIVYTSGTTGRRKGVMLSQRNVAADTVAACRAMTGGHAIGFLPLYHAFSWVGALFSGCLLTEWGFICRSLKDIQSDIQTYHPQNFSAVPMAVEKIYDRIWSTACKTGQDKLLQKGLRNSRLLMRLGIDRRRKIFSTIIDHLGGELEMIVCGGAYLDEKYEKGMFDLGIQVINGYGITECSPAVTCNRLDNFKFGSAGLPLDCNEVRIHEPDEDGVGEIYVRGSNVMMGYYNDPEATAEAFDDGWFKTGDYGYLDKDGFLFFRGRKKNLIVRSDGKNISPEELEDKLSVLPYVQEVLVYDVNGRITAEFYLDATETPDAAQRLKDDVAAVNQKLPLYKQIADIRLRDTEFPKTTTLKIRREYDKRS